MKYLRFKTVLGFCLLTLAVSHVQAHVGSHPSVHDTVAGIIERMKQELSTEQLRDITLAQAEKFLTPKELEILGTEHISFKVNVPVRVSVLHDAKLGNDPFWNVRAFDNALSRHDGYRRSSFICALSQLVLDDITGLPQRGKGTTAPP